MMLSELGQRILAHYVERRSGKSGNYIPTDCDRKAAQLAAENTTDHLRGATVMARMYDDKLAGKAPIK
jgi:hypothetical protein